MEPTKALATSNMVVVTITAMVKVQATEPSTPVDMTREAFITRSLAGSITSSNTLITKTM